MAFIHLLDTRFFDTPNVWSQQSVFVATLRLDPEAPAQFANQRHLLNQSLAELSESLAFSPAGSGVSYAVAEDTLPEAIAALTTQLLNGAGVESAWLALQPGPGPDSHNVVFACPHRRAGELAMRVTLRLFGNALTASPTADERLKEMVKRLRGFSGYSPTTSITQEAARRCIPIMRIDPAGGTLELGNGRYRQRTRGSRTWRTSGLGSEIAGHKERTSAYLLAAGLPVPMGAVVTTTAQANRAAARIGYPVVVKPVDRSGSAGVFLDRQNEEEVNASFAEASATSLTGRVMIERFVAGKAYRANVVGKCLLSFLERLPASVLGDGQRTVHDLIELANTALDHQQSDTPLRPMRLDRSVNLALARQGMTLDSVPIVGQVVQVSQTTGGDGFLRRYSIDRTHEAHPHNVRLILQAMQVLGLDVATLDVVTPDITVPITAENGAIVDVNISSGFDNELDPRLGVSYELGPAMLDMLFPPGQPVRAPIIAIMGNKVQGHAIATEIAAKLQAAGYSVGLAANDGLTLTGTFLRGVEHRGPAGVRTLLNNPATEIVVAEIDADELVAEGLGSDYCDVAIVTELCGQLTPFGKPVESVLTGQLDATGTLVVADDIPLEELFSDDAPYPVVLLIGAGGTDQVAGTVTQAVGPPPGPQPPIR